MKKRVLGTKKYANAADTDTLLNSLVAVWELNDDATDELGISNGTWSGGASYIAGKMGAAGNFNGTSQYVNCGNDASLNFIGAFTTSVWFYAVGLTGAFEVLSSKGYHSGNFVNAQNTPYGMAVQGGLLKTNLTNELDERYLVNSTLSPALNTWYHAVFTWDGTTGANNCTWYIDGALDVQSSQTDVTELNITTDDVRIGNDIRTDSRFYWDGYIDQTAIWNRALTAEEVSTLYNMGSGIEYSTW